MCAKRSLEPCDNDSAGHALWLVLGSKSTNMTAASALLGVSRQRLGAIIHGKEGLSPNFVASKNWAARLARHYPDGWARHGASLLGRIVSVRTGRYLKRPSDTTSFGYVLWLILGGEKGHLCMAATRLGVSQSRISDICSGRVTPSREYLIRNAWREQLSTYYSDGWAIHGAVFEKYAARLPKHAGSLSREPRDKESFGHVLWMILGGKDTLYSEAARQLETGLSFLKQVIHGRRAVSRHFLARKRWRERLAALYPDEWMRNARAFEVAAARLPASRGNTVREPENNESFGHTLYLILGGDKTHLVMASRLLGVSTRHLRAIIRGARHPTRQLISREGWPKVLADHFPDGWSRYASVFDESTARLLAEDRPIANPFHQRLKKDAEHGRP